MVCRASGEKEYMIKHVVKVGGTIGPKPGYSITSFRMPIPGNLYAQGEAYLEAAIALHETPPRKIGAAIPLFFCIAQASELFLKSFLAAQGKDRRLPGWTQHDLAKLQSAALRLGMVLKDSTQATITEIGEQNRLHEFRFLETTKNIVLPPVRRSIVAVKEVALGALTSVEPFMRARDQ
jgi:hypothetical protein